MYKYYIYIYIYLYIIFFMLNNKLTVDWCITVLARYIYYILNTLHYFLSHGQIILPIPFHSKLFQTIQLSNPTNHSIPFHFFSTFFFNFPNPYTISLNLNHLYHLEIHKVKPFNIIFFQTIPNYFQTILTIPINGMEWPKWFAQTQ